MRYAMQTELMDPLWGIQFDETDKIFSNPSQQSTEDYVSGRFG